jgi:tetratricopeptide (TPR) repeat protein
MRKFITITTTLLLALIVATGAFAQVRGRGRIQGNVFDKATGKPIADATVTVSGSSTEPIVVKTDSKGHWAALGMTSGSWNVDIVAAGYQTTRGTVAISELQQIPPIKTELAAEVKQEAAAAVQSSPLVPQAAIDAIKEGQELMAASKFKEAIADFEKALPQIPTDKPQVATVRVQLQEVMAQAYYKAGDLKNAIATLERLNAADPWTTPDANQTARQVLLANLYLENSQLDDAKALVAKLPAGAVADPAVYTNMGIVALNKKKPADAESYFTKAIDLDPKSADAYYYRGLAKMQQKHDKDAKADFQQVLTLSPDSPEAKDAKTLIAGIK